MNSVTKKNVGTAPAGMTHEEFNPMSLETLKQITEAMEEYERLQAEEGLDLYDDEATLEEIAAQII